MLNFTFKELVLPNEQKWTIAPFNIDFSGVDFQTAKHQARLKSQYTMNASQAGQSRTVELKYQRQLMGILAEMGIESYLSYLLNTHSANNLWEVVRYDNIRTDGFKSAANEFDIRIIRRDKRSFLSIESRSSMLHNRDLLSGIETCNIIGPYSSVAKSGESYNDFYFLPVFEYLDYKTKKYVPEEFESLLTLGKIQMHIVGGCTKNVIQTKGRPKSLGQGSTQYQAIQILDASDIREMIPIIINKLY